MSCERQNMTMKDSLVKFLLGNPCVWPNIIEGVLIANRVSKHTSTKFSLFSFSSFSSWFIIGSLLNQSMWSIILSVWKGMKVNTLFYKGTFDVVLTTAICMRANIHQTAGENNCSAQEKQRRNYNRRHQLLNTIIVGQKGWKVKVVNFYLNGLAHSQFIWHQIKTFVP